MDALAPAPAFTSCPQRVRLVRVAPAFCGGLTRGASLSLPSLKKTITLLWYSISSSSFWRAALSTAQRRQRSLNSRLPCRQTGKAGFPRLRHEVEQPLVLLEELLRFGLHGTLLVLVESAHHPVGVELRGELAVQSVEGARHTAAGAGRLQGFQSIEQRLCVVEALLQLGKRYVATDDGLADRLPEAQILEHRLDGAGRRTVEELPNALFAAELGAESDEGRERLFELRVRRRLIPVGARVTGHQVLARVGGVRFDTDLSCRLHRATVRWPAHRARRNPPWHPWNAASAHPCWSSCRSSPWATP